MTAHLPAVPHAYKLFIDGDWRPAADGRVITRVSPAHGVAVATYAQAGAAETDAAIAAARRAFDDGPWPHMTAGERSGLLLKVADLVARDADLIALLDVLESGKPIAQARGEIAGAVDIWRYAAALARTLNGDSYNTLGAQRLGLVLRDPVGVVSLITPWNFPFLIIAQKLPFALAAGCTAVVKPSEMTSASTLHLAGLLAEAGLPNGVVNILAGTGPEVGAAMTADPRVDMVSFTGSTRVGIATMAAAAPTLKKVTMELGGKNPQVVFPDADLEAALDAVVFGAYFNAGECCNAGSRLIIHRDIAEDFVGRVAAEAAKVVVGDPLDERTQVGAIISAEHLARIEGHVAAARAAGASVPVGGERLASAAGQFMAPTIVAGVRPEMAIATDEVFGPVLAVSTFATAADALALANHGDYGLSAAVWSADASTAMTTARGIRAGTVWINTFMDGTPELPFGGVGKSGLGRELGRFAVEDYTELKTLNMHLGPRTAWWTRRG